MKLSLFNLFLLPLAVSAFVPHHATQPIRAVVNAGPDAVVSEAVASADVIVFSKSFCPFCLKTKKLFNSLEIDYTTVELNERDDGADIQDALMDLTGQRTVPSVFIKGKHIGGNSDVQKANKDGTLLKLLQA